MTPERYERLRELFLSVCDLPAQQQAATLDECCADDPSMKIDILALLAMDAKNTRLLESPTLTDKIQQQLAEILATETETPTPKTIGDYRIVRKLGDGGMGAVYEAQQDHPRRTVALKMIRFGLASEKMLKRFEHEAHVLGLLQHPGIAQIYEAGTADTGSGPQPYFAMELVPGEPLTSYAQQNNLGTRQCLELTSKLCDAIQHAHTKGVVHRDLKPGNVLVTEDGQPKILDFGVARATDSDIQTTTLQTDIGQLIGTIPYMSPEQAGGSPDEIDTRSDVYSLGVLLYELLTNRLPHELNEKMIHEAVRVIREEEPTRLSSINPQLRGDIETIVAKALEKDKDRRYQTAGELAADIRRYLNDEPIEARPASAMYQFRKFTKRNTALVGGTAAAFVLLLLGIGGTSYGLLRAVDQRTLAEKRLVEIERARSDAVLSQRATGTEAEKAEAVLVFLQDILSASIPEDVQEGAITVREMLDRASETMQSTSTHVPAVRIKIQTTLAAIYTELGVLDAAEHHALEALATAQGEYGEHHKDTLDAKEVLAGAYLESGRYTEAEPLFDEVRAGMESLFGEKHKQTLEVRNNLGYLYYLQRRLREAENLLRETLALYRQEFGQLDVGTLRVMNNFALVLMELGNFDEAQHMLEQAIEGSKAALGSRHPHTIVAYANLGNLHSTLGRYDLAESVYLEAIDLKREAYGNDHPSVVASKATLATLLWDAGKLNEAESLIRDSLERARRILGDDHPVTLNSTLCLVHMLQDKGDFDAAEEYAVTTHKAALKALGDDHFITLSAITLLARLYYVQGRLEEAEERFSRSLEVHTAVYGEEHPETLSVMSNLGDIYRRRGNIEAAHQIIEKAVQLRTKVLGPEHPSTLTSKNNLGLVLQDLKYLPEAVSLFREVLDLRVQILGENHPSTLTSMNNLATAFVNQGEFDQAVALFHKTLEGRQATFGPDHPGTITTMNNLAVTLQRRGELERANHLIQEVVALRKRILGENHPSSLSAEANLGSVRMDQRRYEEAVDIYEAILSSAEQVYPLSHWRPWSWRRALGECLFHLERFSEAETTLLETLQFVEERFGSHHARTLKVIRSTIFLYEAWDKPEKAAEYRALLEEAEKEPQGNKPDDTGSETRDQPENDDDGGENDPPQVPVAFHKSAELHAASR